MSLKANWDSPPIGRLSERGCLVHVTKSKREVVPKATCVTRHDGFIPIKSRRLMPGGYLDTVTRGWARPICELRNSAPTKKPTVAVVAAGVGQLRGPT